MFDENHAYHAKIQKRGESECWIWVGKADKDGYGLFWHGGRRRNVRSHRYALELATGISPTGLMALHSCDTPACCNPQHLRWGNAAENAADMMARGRSSVRIGEQNAVSKLSGESVAEIRGLFPGVSAAALAERFGISVRNVYRVVRGEGWGHVPGGTGPVCLRRRGEGSPAAVLDEAKVLQIRSMAKTHSRAQIAKIIGVDRSVVTRVVNRKTWAHVEGPP